MVNAGLLRQVIVRYSSSNVRVFEVIIDEDKIREIITTGVKKGNLTFTNRRAFTGSIADFNEYMGIFAPAMAKRIDSLAKPLHRKGDIRQDTAYWFDQLKRTPITAQRDAIEASIKAMELKGKVNMIGECGVGKTHMMLVSNWIYNRRQNQAMKLLVFCPDTLVNTVWKEEVEATLHDCHVHHIKSISDLLKFDKNGFFDDKEDRVFILSQQVAKAGYTLQPAVRWSKAKRGFVCPDCGSVVTEKVKNEKAAGDAPKYIEVPVKFSHFNTERYNNAKCKKCKGMLWEPINKKATKKRAMVYCSELSGYYPREARVVRRVIEELRTAVNAATDAKAKARLTTSLENHRFLEMVIAGTREEGRRISVQKVPVAEFIFKKMQGRFTNLIVDEFHESATRYDLKRVVA
jgi:hypothetical protein